MPYIEQDSRKKFGWIIKSPEEMTEGELNFCITKLCHEYTKRKGLSYKILNQVIGVLECSKLELYRMVAAKYENKKRLENGSVSKLDAINVNEVM